VPLDNFLGGPFGCVVGLGNASDFGIGCPLLSRPYLDGNIYISPLVRHIPDGKYFHYAGAVRIVSVSVFAVQGVVSKQVTRFIARRIVVVVCKRVHWVHHRFLVGFSAF
jgi:hypothetical protein